MDPYPYLRPACQSGTCGDDACTRYRSQHCVTGECSHGAEDLDCFFTPAPGSRFGAALGVGDEQLPDNFAQLVDELSRPIVFDDGTVVPAAMTAEEQPPTAATATAPTWWTDYAHRRTDELMSRLYGHGLDRVPDVRDEVRAYVAAFIDQIMQDMTVSLTIPRASGTPAAPAGRIGHSA